MNIAVLGSGNLGQALANAFRKAGHSVIYGVRNPEADFKGKQKVIEEGISWFGIPEAVSRSEVIVLCVSAQAAMDVAGQLGDVSNKIIIDAMNLVFAKLPGYTNTADAVLNHCNCTDLVKCFNTTGFENIADPIYENEAIDMFVAGSSGKAKSVASRLAKDIGFSEVYDFGGNDRFFLIEQWGMCWINLAILQKNGRNLGFKVLKRADAAQAGNG